MELLKEFLDGMMRQIFYFTTQHPGLLITVFSLIIILEGLSMLIFPKLIKTQLQRLPLNIWRVFGGAIFIMGFLTLYLYLRVLKPFFLMY